jgi:hypothetical protein
LSTYRVLPSETSLVLLVEARMDLCCRMHSWTLWSARPIGDNTEYRLGRGHISRKHADCIERVRIRNDPPSRKKPIRRLKPDNSAVRSGETHTSSRIRSDCPVINYGSEAINTPTRDRLSQPQHSLPSFRQHLIVLHSIRDEDLRRTRGC